MEERKKTEGTSIAHISDIHVTSGYFVEEWGEEVIDILNECRPDILIVTGDLTNDGYPHEHDLAKEYLDEIDVQNKIVLPGNHDARNLGYKIFEEMYGTRFPFYEDELVTIFGMDSTEPDIDDGHIGRENYPHIRKVFSGADNFKILCMHHHLIPIPGTGRERNILVDAGEVLSLCQEMKLDLVLSGHKHLPWVWRLEDMFIINAGTACTRRLKGRSHPSFNMINLYEEGFDMKRFNVVSGEWSIVLQP